MMVHRIMMIAGEASGDAHGAGVIRELKLRQPDIRITGMGGEKMQNEGMNILHHVREMSFMGFLEVVKHLPLIRRVEKDLERELRTRRPDVVVFIDYPGFNLRFARTVKRLGIKSFYYISPQVWAWKKGRVKKIKALIDKMLVVFPFEVPIYNNAHVPVQFVGHPIVEEMQQTLSREEFCVKYRLDPKKKFIAVIPGSRKQEIESLFSSMLHAAGAIAGSERSTEVLVAVAPNLSEELYHGGSTPDAPVRYIQHATHEIMKYAEFAFVTSGTATLETACSETPMVVVYKTSAITYWIARFFVNIKNIALVNIVAEKTVVPEIIQHDVTVDRLVREARSILASPERILTMKLQLREVKEKLGGAGAARNVAEAILAV